MALNRLARLIPLTTLAVLSGCGGGGYGGGANSSYTPSAPPPPSFAAPALAILYPSQVIPSPVTDCDTTNFGRHIDMSGSRAAISSEGAAYVYSRNPTLQEWIIQARPDPGHVDDFFGNVTQINNDMVVTFGFGHSDVFVIDQNGIWQPTDRLLNPAGGFPVALNSEWLVVNGFAEESGGSVYVFRRTTGGQFNFTARLVPDDRGDPNTSTQDFGVSAALGDDVLLIGAPGDRDGTGAVYVFKSPDFETWRQVQKLLPADEVRPGKGFGNGIDVRDNIAAIAATGSSTSDPVMAPAVYMFVDDGTKWQQQQKLTDPDPADSPTSRFGTSDRASVLFPSAVAVDSLRVVIGEFSDDLNRAPHEAYVFERSGNQWTPTSKLQRAPEFSNARGVHISLDGNVVLMGARVDSSCGPNAVFAYDLPSC